MPEKAKVERFIESLYGELEDNYWGLIDWESADREDFQEAIREAWNRAKID